MVIIIFNTLSNGSFRMDTLQNQKICAKQLIGNCCKASAAVIVLPMYSERKTCKIASRLPQHELESICLCLLVCLLPHPMRIAKTVLDALRGLRMNQLLTTLAPMLKYNLCDDGFGNLIVVYADSWASAFFHVHGSIA